MTYPASLSDRYGRRRPLVVGTAIYTLANAGCALGPTLGGLILGVAPWHAIFWLTAVYGGVYCVLVWRLLPDTLPRHRRMQLGLSDLAVRYAGVLRDRVFLSYALMSG